MSTPEPTESTERAQHQALYLTAAEAQNLLNRVRNSTFLMYRGIEVYTVPADPMPMQDGSKQDGVFLMVRAETDLACGMGVGFVTAICEGVSK